MTVTDDNLLAAATEACGNAHAPYSGYTVGAAVLDEQGRVHVGCNVENASFPEGICAEANAIGTMVAGGGKRIVSIAVIGAATSSENNHFAGSGTCAPCGGCRQRILEFADADTRVIMLNNAGEQHSLSIDALLPESFRAG